MILSADIKMPNYITPLAADLCSRLLLKNPKQRIGCSKEKGVDEIKEHPWFKDIDWGMLERKEIEPPFKPQVRNSKDLSCIDEEFLQEPVAETPHEPNEMLAQHNTDALFKHFSFVNETNM